MVLDVLTIPTIAATPIIVVCYSATPRTIRLRWGGYKGLRRHQLPSDITVASNNLRVCVWLWKWNELFDLGYWATEIHFTLLFWKLIEIMLGLFVPFVLCGLLIYMDVKTISLHMTTSHISLSSFWFLLSWSEIFSALTYGCAGVKGTRDEVDYIYFVLCMS